MTKCLYCCVVQAAFPEDGKCPNCGAPMQWSQRAEPERNWGYHVGTQMAYSQRPYNTYGLVRTYLPSYATLTLSSVHLLDEHNAAMRAADEARARGKA